MQEELADNHRKTRSKGNNRHEVCGELNMTSIFCGNNIHLSLPTLICHMWIRISLGLIRKLFFGGENLVRMWLVCSLVHVRVSLKHKVMYIGFLKACLINHQMMGLEENLL